MSNNNVLNEKKKALLAYKEKILDEIKYYERSIDEFCANHKNSSYDDHNDSSDSEDDFPFAIEMGPSIPQLKQQQAMMKTCLHATQELTSLMVLQSGVDVLVEEPKLDGERPVSEAGTWREVTAECRIDLIPFTMTFFMHTPDRKFAPPSYRGLRVVPVKNVHEIELANSVLHSLKLPSDAVEVLRSYAAGYRSRRTTLARLANKYANTLFMEPHAEGGFVLKCADLLEVSWRLENKWSPVAPFHHRMKFDLEFMDESYIKTITQVHKKLSDPALQTDERTLLLAQIITTCLEARGPIDESDLESKTTEIDNDIEKRDSENEKRDSEVMAPPKSLPKKGKQKNKDGVPNAAQKRSLDDENGDGGAAKKMKNDAHNDGTKKNIADTCNNPRKSKINDMVNEGSKKRKINDVNKVTSSKNVKDTGNTEGGNTKPKNVKKTDETEDIISNTDSKPKNMKEPANIEDKTSAKTKNKAVKDTGDVASTDINDKPTKLKELANADSNTKPKTKIVKKTGINKNKDGNVRPKEKNTKKSNNDVKNSGSATNNNVDKETINVEKVKNKPKNVTTKEASNPENVDQNKNNAKIKNKPKNLPNVKSKESIDTNKVTETDVERPKSKNIAKTTNAEAAENVDQNRNNAKIKNNLKKLSNVKSKECIDSNKVTETDVEHPKSKNIAKTANAEAAKNADQNKNNAKIKNNPKKLPNVKSKENIDSNKVTETDVERPKSKNIAKTANAEAAENADQYKNNAIIKNNPKKLPNVKSKESIYSNEIAAEPPTSKITEKMTNAENVDKNNVKSNPKNLPNVKSKASIDSNKMDAERPKTKITDNMTSAAITKKNIQTNVNKIDTETTKTKAKNLANTKNSDQDKKVIEKDIKNKEKLPEVANKGSEKTVKEKTVNSNVDQTVKKVTEKNATNIRNKDKISQINNKISEKSVKNKLTPVTQVPEKKLSNNIITKNTKEITNNKKMIKASTKIITHKISSHRNSLKPQNPPKTLKAGNTKIISTGNIEKENGGKGSKIPQKRLSPVSEGSSKKNLLRISPRKNPSKFKTSQETFKQKMVKTTNIPRLLKKPGPKTTS